MQKTLLMCIPFLNIPFLGMGPTERSASSTLELKMCYDYTWQGLFKCGAAGTLLKAFLLQSAGEFCKPAIFMLVTRSGASTLHHFRPAGILDLI